MNLRAGNFKSAKNVLVEREHRTNALMRAATIRNPEKSFYGPIDFIQYKRDIQKRKELLKLLDKDRKSIKAKLYRTQNMRLFNEEKLRMANVVYHQTILDNIVRIQRWFRNWKQKRIFKTLLKEDLKKQQKDLIL